MKLKTGLLLLFTILSFSIVHAQQRVYSKKADKEKGFQKEKLFYGGNLGLSFGTVTYINLSPLIGYRFSEMFAAGAQINGIYESVDYGVETDKYGLVGLGVFGRFYPIPQIFLHVQPEMNYVMGKVKYENGQPEGKYHHVSSAFLAGGGYSQSIGPNSAFVIMILFDILQSNHSPYGSQPIFRMGVNVGF